MVAQMKYCNIPADHHHSTIYVKYIDLEGQVLDNQIREKEYEMLFFVVGHSTLTFCYY